MPALLIRTFTLRQLFQNKPAHYYYITRLHCSYYEQIEIYLHVKMNVFTAYIYAI